MRIFMRDGDMEAAMLAGHTVDLSFGPRGAWFDVDLKKSSLTPFQRFILERHTKEDAHAPASPA